MASIADKDLNQAALSDILNSILTDITALDTAIDTLTTKLNTDFTAQNAAVTSSQLDVDYAGSAAITTTV